MNQAATRELFRQSNIREKMPDVLKVLLLDRTTSTPAKSRNIIWANDHYQTHDDPAYAATAEIKLELISGPNSALIMPRSLKTAAMRKERTKTKAEVFTPTWIVKKQNDAAESDYLADDLETYISRKWLEITCGEAPYMATRYDMETGKMLPLDERCGFVDRKLARINAEIEAQAEWQHLVERAYKTSFGFEWNGDSLLLARENLLYTYRDYYLAKWHAEPSTGLLLEIAKIISYNLFQMDGLTYTVPLSRTKRKMRDIQPQLNLFNNGDQEQDKWEIVPGKRVRIMNWETDRMEFFDKGMVRP